MIASIGFKRLLILLILVGAAVLLGFLNFYVFQPQSKSAASKLGAITSENEVLSAEIKTMQSGMERFMGQKDLFERITQMGIFNEQNRVIARERFNVMQKLSKILAAKYEIRPATIVSANLSGDINKPDAYGILRSPISVTLSALDDLDIYRFIYYLNYSFPGHITINNLHMERVDTVSPETLKEIGEGKPSELVSAKLELDWSTIVNTANTPIPAAVEEGAQP